MHGPGCDSSGRESRPGDYVPSVVGVPLFDPFSGRPVATLRRCFRGRRGKRIAYGVNGPLGATDHGMFEVPSAGVGVTFEPHTSRPLISLLAMDRLHGKTASQAAMKCWSIWVRILSR